MYALMADTTVLKLFYLNKEWILNPIWHRCQFWKWSVKMLHSHKPLNIVTNFPASLFTHWHFASHIKAVNTGKLRIIYGMLFPTWGTVISFAPFSMLPCELLEFTISADNVFFLLPTFNYCHVTAISFNLLWQCVKFNQIVSLWRSIHYAIANARRT